MQSAPLSFTVSRVRSHADLRRACAVRAEAYGRKDPGSVERLARPDAIDEHPRTTSYLCTDKASGRPIGTMRVQTATEANPSLEIEKAAELVALQGSARSEFSRLSAVPHADPLVCLALWKVGYLHCLSQGIRWIIMGARKPGLLRAYASLGAREVAPPVALPYAGHHVHRVLGLDLLAAEADWPQRQHPLLAFMVDTLHPDLPASLQTAQAHALRSPAPLAERIAWKEGVPCRSSLNSSAPASSWARSSAPTI